MDQSKQQTLMMTGKVKKYLTSIFAVIFIFIGVTASLSHKLFLPASANPEIAILDKKRDSLKDFWNKTEQLHDKSFLNNEMSKKEYFELKLKNEKARIEDFKKIRIQRKRIALNFSFNGRNSFHYWLWTFGVFFTMLIISILLALKDARLKKAGLLKWYEPHATVSFISISLFWLYYTVFQKNYDFSLDVYMVMLFCVLIPLSYFIYHFVRRIFIIEEKLSNNVRSLIHYILKSDNNNEEEKWNLLEKVSNNGR